MTGPPTPGAERRPGDRSTEAMLPAIRDLYRNRFGAPPVSVEPIAADGSARRMVRVRGPDGRTAVGVQGPDPDENRAFLSYSRTFRSLRLPVPEVFAVDEGAGVYLVEDLGDTTLFRALCAAREAEGGGWPASMTPVYRRVLEVLPRFQVDGGRAIDFSAAHPRAAFDRQSMQWDLDYFKYHFVKLAGVRFNEDRLQRDFDRLISFLLEAEGAAHADLFLYRDFQSRNVMLRRAARASDPDPWFIDYQGGRRGAPHYDVASLLYDAKADLPEDLRESLLAHYVEALSERLCLAGGDRERFLARFVEHYRGYVAIRILQAMGAYGYRGFYERKTHFLRSVPLAVANVERLLARGLVPVDVPELEAVLARICASPSLREAPAPARAGLHVRVGSFSYRFGYPGDPQGHGGGFVFDCRAIGNPGTLPAFARLTGRDEPVARFLEAEAATAGFLSHVLALVEAQVRAYAARGFVSLDVQFGCTGGQHRSVYFAERVGAALAARFPESSGVRVSVVHRERDRWPAAPIPGTRNVEPATWTR